MFIAASLLSLSPITVAQIDDGWSAPTTLSDLRIFNGTSIFVNALDLPQESHCNAGTSNPDAPASTRLRIEGLYAETYALLLAAQSSGKSVELYLTGDCSSRHAWINGARLVD